MSSSTPFQIIIVGGGIARMAPAISLRGPNHKITILERSRLNNEIRAAIPLQPNATRILQQTWQLTDVVDDADGMIDHGFRIYRVDGALVNGIPLQSKPEYVADRIVWHRQDVHRYLKEVATSV